MHSHPVEPEELMAYLDGELPAPEAVAAAEHLSRCRECQAVAADLQSVSRRMMTWQIEAPEQGMKPALAGVLEQREAPPRIGPGRKQTWHRRWPWVLGLACACGVLLVLMQVTTRRSGIHDLEQPRPRAFLKLPAPSPAFTPVAADQISAPPGASDRPLETNGPLIVHTAQLTIATREFAKTRGALEALLASHGGHIAQLTANSPTDSGRTLQATLRVPDGQLQALLAGLRTLGRVESESQGGEEVTQQVTDLDARLANARTTEQRLAEILRERTGKISDVLEVEREMDRVRGEIERMVAERKNLGDRLAFATVDVTITEEYQAGLQVTPPAASIQLRNAAVDGWKNLIGSLFGVAQFLLAAGPVLFVWAALLFFPARALRRRFQKGEPPAM
jgi:hypothetical protein